MLANKIVSGMIEKYAAREKKISSISLTFKSLSHAKWVGKVVRFINKLPLPIRLAFSRYESTLYVYSSSQDNALYEGVDKHENLMLNLGSGAFKHPRWFNIDFPGQSDYYKSIQGKPYKDFLPADLTKYIPLPFEDESVALIYCCHTIEHLPEDKAENLLRDCARMLKKGGGIRLVFPDVVSDYLNASINASQHILSDRLAESVVTAAYNSFSPSGEVKVDDLLEVLKSENFHPENVAAKLRQMDEQAGAFRPDHPEYHLSLWTHEKLTRIAKKLGFSMYLPMRRGMSEFKPFMNTSVFDTTEPQYSLYGELIK